MRTPDTKPGLLRGDSLEGAIATTVAYLDVFAFAPYAHEIHRFLVGWRATRREVETALTSPELIGVLGSFEDTWFLAGKEHLALRRPRSAVHGSTLWQVARTIAHRIERTGLASSGLVTGSLAADNADEYADVDFLFTYPESRTWTSFALVRLLAKVPVFGLGKLCPNYVLSEAKLEIRPQNLFTAWEIAKAVPMFGFDVYRRFLHANRWIERFLPNAMPQLAEPRLEANGTRDPFVVRALTESALFQKLESFERRRKYGAERKDVGVDMEARAKQGSMDRHSPTRSFYVLSELRYRMSMMGLFDHPLYREIEASTSPLQREMQTWAGRPLAVESR